jgi:hypothetical protein
MGWFSDAISVVSNVFSSGGGSSWLGPAVTAGAEIYGAYSQVQAQQDAAKQVQAGFDARTASIEAGNRAAQERLGGITAGAQPATDYLRRIIAQDPYAMTPGQTTGLEDTLRAARNRVASGGLRGAGRAGAAVVNEASRRFTDAATSQNIARGDAAASQLSGQGYGATSQAAGLEANTGLYVGAGAVPRADVGASADVENAALKGSVIGTLSSFIANDQKERANESKYKDWKSKQGEV